MYLELTHQIKVIRHVFGFGIEIFENKDIDIFGHLMVLILSRGLAAIRIFHLFQLPDIVDLELGVLPVMVNGTYL